MSSGMNMEQAKEYAKTMTYRQAVMNCLYARCVPYCKATRIKMKELLEFIENCPFAIITENGIDIDIEIMKSISHYAKEIKKQ